MERKYKFIFLFVVIAFVWIGVIAVLQFGGDKNYHGDEFHRPAFDFSLTDHQNREFILSEHRGKVVLLSFGFANCPDICPGTLRALGDVLDLIEDKVSDNVKALFITVDPERDTVSKLGIYVPFFHEGIIGLTGSEKTITEISKACGVFYLKDTPDEDGNYQVTHSPSIYLINARGEIILRYPREKLDPDKIAQDIKRLLRRIS